MKAFFHLQDKTGKMCGVVCVDKSSQKQREAVQENLGSIKSLAQRVSSCTLASWLHEPLNFHFAK